MKKLKINKNKVDDLPKFPVGFGSATIMLPYPVNPREGVCDACGRSKKKGEIKQTYLHHWKYAYRHSTVKKDPFKVLENLSELCYTCHKHADGIRAMLEKTTKKNLWRIVRLMMLMTPELKEKEDWVSKAYLEARKNDTKVKLEEYWTE